MEVVKNERAGWVLFGNVLLDHQAAVAERPSLTPSLRIIIAASLQVSSAWSRLPMSLASSERARLLFEQVDTNGDGVLSAYELRAWLELNGEESLGNSLFSALDTDGDGVVSLKEFSEGFEQVMKHEKKDLPPPSNDQGFPRSGVRLAWLRRFVHACKGKKYTWSAKDFLKAEHGGVGDAVVHVSTDNLQEHRARMNAAGKDGDGKQTTVQYADIPFDLMTTNDVCFGIVKPATEHVRTSYVELLKSTEPAEVKSATAFVSHAWKYTFVNVVDALSGLSEDAFVWFDVFTVNQHASLQVPPDWWFTTFKEAVASIGHTVLVLMPWDDPIPLTRAWCIWEILSTIDDGKAKLEICLPAVEQKAFADFLVEEGADEVTVKMVGMDVQRAEAWKKEDRDAILNAVKVYPGGASEVNKLIKDEMRSWVVESAKRALDTLDSEKRATSKLLMSVADLLSDQGKYADAEPLHREALDGYRRELGDIHPDTLKSINGLAGLLSDQGKHADAEPLYREALDGYRRELGDAHPDTLVSINNLAILLKKQGKYADAEPLYREALDGFRRELGDAHPNTLNSINNLAALLYEQGKYADAEPLYREALDGQRRELGDAHPDTLMSINNLAGLLQHQGKYDEADTLFREALDGRRRELGDAHPSTLDSINNLAILLYQNGKYADAEPLYREALDGRRRELGDAHPSTLDSISNLAILLKDQGKYDNAEPLYREALDGYRRKLGDAHPHYGDSCYNFANFLMEVASHTKARRRKRRRRLSLRMTTRRKNTRMERRTSTSKSLEARTG